ncbi:hypothetical protein Y032_0005g2406 [Ancylostoma ceylanicum]|nr:hypothetical protein Y032_0005g2406 [Ancylostoma ceylanicum]
MFYSVALTIFSLLPALCKGQFCDNGQLLGADIYEYIVDPVNEYREKLLKGEQKNGNSGSNLPPPQGMTKLTGIDCNTCQIQEHVFNERVCVIVRGSGAWYCSAIGREDSASFSLTMIHTLNELTHVGESAIPNIREEPDCQTEEHVLTISDKICLHEIVEWAGWAL